MIKYMQGNVLTAPTDIIAHGCNCRGGFGSGVAGQISQLYPNVREKYLEKFKKQGWQLGDVQLVKVNNHNQWIANCATQDYYGRGGDGKVYADYLAIRQVMERLKEICENGGLSLAMPCIGAGLAGGDWAQIEAIINDVFKEQIVYVYKI